MIFTVEVGVALNRPPTTDEIRKVRVIADNATEASIIAAQIASCTSVMPVSTKVLQP